MLHREINNSSSSFGAESEAFPLEVPNVSYIISAEFHNKLGPIVKYQYPKSIPGFRQSLYRESNGYTSVSTNLASLMIPSSIEQNPGKPDLTTFTLYYNRSTQCYQLFPVPKDTRLNPHQRDQSHSRSYYDVENNYDEKNKRHTIVIEDDTLESQKSYNNQEMINNDTLFFINVANAVLDTSNDRGAVIKSIAIGTPLKTFFAFKSILVSILDLYMTASSQAVSLGLLIDCFEMLNSIDLSLINKIHSKASTQDVLHSVCDESVIARIFMDLDSTLKRLFHIGGSNTNDRYGNIITFDDQFVQYHFTKFKPTTLPLYVLKIPLQFNMVKSNPIYIENDYHAVVLRFLNKFIPYLLKAGSKSNKWKLVINSTKLNKEDLCAFILSLANITATYAGDSQPYFKGSAMLVFPFMDISLVDGLRAYLTSNIDFLGSFAIIGTANPIFRYQIDIWDYYYDMDADIFYESGRTGNYKPTPRVEQKNGSKGLKKMFNKPPHSSPHSLPHSSPHSSPHAVAQNQANLGQKFISLLIGEYHDSDTMMSVLRRLNVLQLESLLNATKKRESSFDIALKDEYIVTYKDFFLFPEFFDYFTLHCIELLSTLDSCLLNLGSTRQLFTIEQTYSQFSQIFSIVKELFRMVSINKTNVEKFLNACLNYSPSRILPLAELQTDTFSKWSFEKEVNRRFNNFGSHMGTENDTHGVLFSSIDLFTHIYSFDILAVFLTFTGKDDERELLNTKSMAKKRTSFSLIAQSSSLKQLLQMTTRSNAKNSRTNGQEFGNLKESCYTNASSIVSPKLKASPLLERTATKISYNITLLLFKLECHPVGKVLLKKYLHKQFREAYEELKTRYVGANKDSGSGDRRNASSVLLSSPSTRDLISLSSNRTGMLNNLKEMSDQRESMDIETGSFRNNY
ncbi:Afi1p [Saccharomyces eubayanus]|uniref:Afi1p n=1 Tax=Saccharomyces eubayanus TaxID=1080349 RepID=UPI0006BFA47C|nr:AFI1-like protein [Saccharomyces eubayanus]KOG96629.1 AFI1-like protein [Saccharomyces eubayanus]